MAETNVRPVCPVCETAIRYLKHSIQCGCGAKFRNVERIKRGLHIKEIT